MSLQRRFERQFKRRRTIAKRTPRGKLLFIGTRIYLDSHKHPCHLFLHVTKGFRKERIPAQ